MVADFRYGFHAANWDPIWEDFYCDLRELWFNQRIDPPSWVIGDEAIATACKGILFRSHWAETGKNLVIYPDTFLAPDSLAVFDPVRALPKNQDSWV